MMEKSGSANHGALQSTGISHFAVRPEPFRMAGGTKTGKIDMRRKHTGTQKPQTIQTGQIHVPFWAMLFHTGGSICPQSGQHGIGYIVVGFKAAGADARAESNMEIGGIGAVSRLHGMNRFFHNSGRAATPTGVDSAHSAGYRIVKQEIAAVGGKDEQGQVGVVGDQSVRSVAPFPEQPLSGVLRRADTDGGFMNLAAQNGAFCGNVGNDSLLIDRYERYGSETLGKECTGQCGD